MKKLYASFFLSAIFCCGLNAQFYIAPRAAYYFPVNSNWVGSNVFSNWTGYTYFSGYYCSLGNGTGLSTSIGFQTSRLMQYEAFVSVNNGKSISRKFTDTTSGYNNRTENEMLANMHQLKLGGAVGLHVIHGNWVFETKSSLFVGIQNELHLVNKFLYYDNGNPSFESESKLVQYGGFAPGFSQSFQVGYNINRFISTSLGFELVGQYWKPKFGVNDNVKYEYTDSFTQPDPNAQPGDPIKSFVQTYTLNTVGLNCSIVFTLPPIKSKPVESTPQ